MEVLANVPLVCSKQLLLPGDVQIVPTLRQSYPTLYKESPQEEEEEEVCFEGWNMNSVSRLLQLLVHALVSCMWVWLLGGVVMWQYNQDNLDTLK